MQLEGGVESLAISADLQLDDLSANMLRIDGGAGDRAVKMPESNRNGAIFRIANVGATNVLNLQDSTGSPISGVTTALGVGQAAWIVNEGGTWRHLGIETIVL
jgi:hypothetical protein